MFRDAQNREWSTAITVNTVKRVQQRTGVLLTDAADSHLIENLYSDVVLLCDVVAAICLPQAEERGLLASDLGELMVGDVIDRACESLMEDLVLFFPSGRRDIVKRIHAAAREAEQQKVAILDRKMTPDQLTKLLAMATTTAEKQIDELLARLGDSSGETPESSESTPES